MRVKIGLTLLFLLSTGLVSCVGGSTSPTSPTSPAPPLGGPAESEVEAFVALVNAHRQSLGRSALVWDATAATVALAHSEDMATRNFFSHTNPEGDSPFDRMRAAGMHYTRAGENIAYGFTSARAVFDAWMASPGHRSNLENPDFTHHGVGRSGTYWTHVFFTPAPS